MPLFSLGDRHPRLASDECYVAPNATIVGSVDIGHQANIWFNVVIRSDNERITIGARVNVQDASVLHADPDVPLTLEHDVCIGHKAMLHGCTIGEASLIGMNSTILNHVVIGRSCIVGAGALIPERKRFPEGVLILGAPAKAVRDVTDEERAWILGIAEGYVRRAARFKTELKLQSP